MNSKKHRPILRGRVVGQQIFVHCPWCDKEHIHGYDPKDGFRPSPRVPHCFSGPFHEGGDYLVAPFRKTDVSHLANSWARQQERHELDIQRCLKERGAANVPVELAGE